MTKADIVNQITARTGVQQKHVQAVVQLTFDHIVDALVRNGRIELRDFGVFEVRQARSRSARNPRTGERVTVPERRRIRFRAGRSMERRVRAVDPSS